LHFAFLPFPSNGKCRGGRKSGKRGMAAEEKSREKEPSWISLSFLKNTTAVIPCIGIIYFM